MRGDRQWLQNLAVNPGFEAPSGPAVTAFNDGFANLNAYTTISGAAPSLAANMMTIPNGTTIQFGSPSWGSINQWKVRVQHQAANATFNFFPHLVDGSNFLEVQIFTNQIALFHTVTETSHQLVLANPTLTAGNFYWLTYTQFPSVSGDPLYLQASLFNDSAGTLGTAVASGGIAAPAFDAVTSPSGYARIQAAAVSNMVIGGAFAGVHVVSLFGPGGWLFTDLSGTATAISSGVWEQNAANTHPNRTATSVGAARIDLARAVLSL